MKENNYKPQIPDVMEAIFDTAYLLFDLVAAILFFIFSQGKVLFILYGILTLTLCGGDAFHLVPRIIRAVHGSNDKIKRQLGIGLQVSSITMTVFYIILMYIWKFMFTELKIPVIIEAVIWISAIVRIVICMLPQNNWCTDEGNMKLSVIRNAVFAVTGIGVIILYLISGNTYGYHMTRMVAAIIISFGCYLPVTLFSKTKGQKGNKVYMEIQILNIIQNLRTDIGDTIVPFITKLGDAGMIWICLTIVLLIIPKTRKTGVIMMAALLVDVLLCNVLIKNLVARTRPFDVNTAVQLLVAKPRDYSFPSGHTAASFASVTALYLAGEKKMWKAALVLAVLIALSRLYLYVHYPTDIIGGVIFGSLSGYLGYKIVEQIQKKR